jgi:SurA N-terminal domain
MVIRFRSFRAGALVALAASGLVLAGCAAGPSQVDSAAIVGDTSVSVDQVQQELNTVLNTQPKAQQAQQQGKLDTVSRGIVSAQVVHTLVAQAQQREHIVVTDAQVDQLVDSSGGADAVASQLLYDADGVRDLAKDQLVEEALGRKYADRLSLTFSYFSTASRQEAVSKAQQIAEDPGSIKGMIAQAGSNGGQAGAQLDLAQYLQQPTGDLAPLFGAQPGTVVAFQPSAQQSPGWLVALVTNRSVAPPTAGQGSTADSADPQALVAIGAGLLQPYAQAANIRISPRYGVWDYAGMQVVASQDQASGLVLQAHTSPQS